MTRHKKKRTAHQPLEAARPVNERGATNATSITVDEFTREAELRRSEGNWAGLLELGAMPISAFAGQDQEHAHVPLLLCKLRGLTQQKEWYSVSRDVSPAELLEILEELRRRVPDFHLMPEFEFYYSLGPYEVKGLTRALDVTVQAFARHPSATLLRHLRRVVLRLHAMQGNDWEQDYTEEERVALGGLPALLPIFRDACRVLEQAGASEEALLARIFRLDATSLDVAPDEVEALVAEIRALPTPGIARLYAPDMDSGQPSLSEHRLTALAWAFLVDVAHTGRDGWGELDARYPDRLGFGLCDGLKLLVKAAISTGEEADRLLIAGVTRLCAQPDDVRDESVPPYLYLSGDATEALECGFSLASIPDFVLRLIEHAPTTLQRGDALLTLYHVLAANNQYALIGEYADTPVALPELDWLAQQSLSFACLLASVAPTDGQRAFFAVQSLRRYIEHGEAYPGPPVLDWRTTERELSVDEPTANRILAEMERVHELRALMDDTHRKRWHDIVAPVLAAAAEAYADLGASPAYQVAQALRDDLLDTAPLVLAQLEYKVGATAHAFMSYGNCFGGPNQTPAASAMLALIQQATTSESLRHFQAVLTEGPWASTHAAATAPLVQSVRKRLSECEKQEQFEKTALARWPALSAQARKVLAVLDTVTSFGNFEELGTYAGMSGEWADRHYRRLLADGMIFETGNSYRLNPHIRPLVAQESRHTVISKIIRSGGTSAAVKQVFNSEREHTIYRAMVQLCPNHLVFPNCSLQSIFSYERMKEMVTSEEFSYYLMASVDLVVVSTTTYLPLLAIEVDSIYHDTEKQLERDGKKDRIFEAGGVPLMRLRPVGSPSPDTIRSQVAEHMEELVRSVRQDMPGYRQAFALLEDLTGLGIGG
ncbi:MAG TPA: DUF2726 domain-containing protein [Trinickia sp.]|uniref:DUF2726 domain-containing protein n=1 Tax=Trinickia sp. TaxID=2571163 RepID=UPI002B50FA17|nr:DUF2726 domain-containing protein [Trinickia sp.]HVW51603.1 DUF2726 domain-containing protein [Trinickia sp.]